MQLTTASVQQPWFIQRTTSHRAPPCPPAFSFFLTVFLEHWEFRDREQRREEGKRGENTLYRCSMNGWALAVAYLKHFEQ